MIAYLLFAAFSSVVAVAISALLDWRWPTMPRRRIVVLSVLAFPTALLMLVVIGSVYFLSWDCPPGDVCDAGGMAFVGLVTMGSIATFTALKFGFASAHLALRYLRKT